MWVRKFGSEVEETTVSATLEPVTGHSLDELLAVLKDCEASIERLGANSLSFDGLRADLERIETIAEIYVLPSHRFSRKYM